MAGIMSGFFLQAKGAQADRPKCGDHGHVAGCDDKTSRILCSDSSLDLRFPCTRPKPSKHKPAVQVLKFKPATDRGQILSPNQKAPTTTLEASSATFKPAAVLVSEPSK